MGIGDCRFSFPFFSSVHLWLIVCLISEKAMGSYHTYSIPGKTAALVPEFAVEDLPLAELQPKYLQLQ